MVREAQGAGEPRHEPMASNPTTTETGGNDPGAPKLEPTSRPIEAHDSAFSWSSRSSGPEEEQLHPTLLFFKDPNLERKFRAQLLEARRQESRWFAVIIVVVLLTANFFNHRLDASIALPLPIVSLSAFWTLPSSILAPTFDILFTVGVGIHLILNFIVQDASAAATPEQGAFNILFHCAVAWAWTLANRLLLPHATASFGMTALLLLVPGIHNDPIINHDVMGQLRLTWGLLSVMLLFHCYRTEVLTRKAWIKIQLELERSQAQRDQATQKALHMSVELQAIAKAKRTADSLLSYVSHELRNPLNGIVNVLDFASGSLNEACDMCGENRNLRDKLSGIVSDCQNALVATGLMTRIVDDVLEMSEVEEGKVVIKPSPTSCTRLARELSVTMKHTLNSNIEFRTITPPNDIDLECDAVRVKQIVTHFLSNAAKHTKEGSITLELSLHQRHSDTPNLRITVTDTGRGISESVLRYVFEPYVQDSSSKLTGGVGLGLYLCKQLATLLGGRVSCESVYGQGASFALLIPVTRLKGPAPQSPSRSNSSDSCSSPEATKKRLQCLVVDDVPLNVSIMKRKLEALGHDVHTANNGKVAVDLVADRLGENPDQRAFDITFMDIVMPVLDGRGATQQIRELEAQYKVRPMPIVAVTGDVTEGDRSKCMAVGMNDHYRKPVTDDTIELAMKHVRPPKPTGEHPHTGEKQRPEVPNFVLDTTEQRKLRCLVVDDVPLNVMVLKRRLEVLKHEVTTACNGQEAVTAVQSKLLARDASDKSPPFDIVFMDVVMPILDGRWATRQIRELEANFKAPPMVIAAVTGDVTQGDRTKCLEAGMNAHFRKPVTNETIQNALSLLQSADKPDE